MDHDNSETSKYKNNLAIPVVKEWNELEFQPVKKTIPKSVDNIVWNYYDCEVCKTQTGYLEGSDPTCARCIITAQEMGLETTTLPTSFKFGGEPATNDITEVQFPVLNDQVMVYPTGLDLYEEGLLDNRDDDADTEESYCLQDKIKTTDPQMIARIRSECADLGCNICISETSFDDINWPKHYNTGTIEVIDAIESWDLDFRLANVIKYVVRAGKKDLTKTKQDLDKAIWYIQRFIDKEC